MAKYYLYPDGNNAIGGGIGVVGAASAYLAVDEPYNSPNDSDYIYSSATASGANGGASFTLGAMANAISINWIKVWARIAREVGAGGTDTAIDAGIIVSAVNYNGLTAYNPPTTPTTTLVGTWNTNPGTSAAWTKSDLDALMIFVDMWDPAVTYRAPSLLQFYVEVDYVAAPTQLGQSRIIGSQLLRLFRKPLDSFEVTLPIKYAYLEVGDQIDLSHFAVPHATSGYGAGDKTWQRQRCLITATELDLDACVVKLKLLDLRRSLFVVNVWDTARTDINPGGVVEDGVARLDNGAGRTFSRASTAWCNDPSDGRVVELTSNTPMYVPDRGMLIEPQRTNLILNSSFAQFSITFTNWTTFGTGVNGSSVGQDTSNLLFDPTVSAQSCKITMGNPNGADTGVKQTVAVANNTYHLSVDYESAGSYDISYRAQRTSDNWYYNESTEAWQAGSVWNSVGYIVGAQQIDYPTPGSTTRMRKMSAIATGAATNIVLEVGGRSTLPAGTVLNLFHVQFELGDSVTSRIVTKSATVTRNADVCSFANSPWRPSWPWEAGTVMFEYTPNQTRGYTGLKNIIRMQFDGSGAFLDALFVPVGGGMTFRRRINSVNTDITTASQQFYPLTRYKIAIRMVGAESELGLAPWTVEVFVNGVKILTGATGYYNELPAVQGGLYWGGSSTGVTCEGAVRNLLIVPWVLTDEEIRQYP